MEYFFKKNNKNIELISHILEEYSGILFRGDKILFKCELCNFYIASSDIKYNLCYNYPDYGIVISNEIKCKKSCCHCLEKIKELHNVYFIKKVSD